MYSDKLSLYFTISVQSLALTEEWLSQLCLTNQRKVAVREYIPM